MQVGEISFAAYIFWLKAKMYAGFLNMHVEIFCEIKESAVKLFIMTVADGVSLHTMWNMSACWLRVLYRERKTCKKSEQTRKQAQI